MRALSVRQPWADLILSGVKDVENRTWPVPSTLPQWERCTRCDLRRGPGLDEASYDDLQTPCFGGHHSVPVEDGPFPFRIGIHASKTKAADGWDRWGEARGMDECWPTDSVQDAIDALPLGALVGYVTVTGAHESGSCWRWSPVAPGAAFDGGRHPVAGRGERPGFCSRWAEPDCWHWTLADPEPLDVPVPMKGALGLWRLPAEVRL